MSYSHRGLERLAGLLDDIAKKLVKPKEELPLANSTLDRAVQRAESIARRLFLLPQLPSNVATVTVSIGTTGRDYSTITSWEADLDNGGIYSAADDAVGECYNDTAFDEFTTIDSGGTIGLNSILLTVADGQEHDGTAGSGVRIVRTGDNALSLNSSIPTVTSWMEIDMNGNGGSTEVIRVGTASNSFLASIANIILHDATDDVENNRAVYGNGSYQLRNSIFYDMQRGSSVSNGTHFVAGNASNRNVKIFNATVFNCGNNRTLAGNDAIGLSVGDDEAADELKNNIVVGTFVSGASTASDFNLGVNSTSDYNLSSDTTAADRGSNSLTSKTASNQFVSIVGGSEDLHLKTGADAIDAGTDLGTTPTGVNIDINGRDRDSNGDTWDIGAHEFVAAGGGATGKSNPLYGVFGGVLAGVLG